MRRLAPRWMAVLLLAAGAACAPLPGQEAPFLETPPRVVDTMLRLAKVSQDDVVYDLGSGDGRIVIAAASDFGARGVGIEIDPRLVASSTRWAERAGLTERVRFVQQDIFDADLRPATVVTLYLTRELNLRLRSKLMVELRPGTRIVSHRFDMGNWAPQERVNVDMDGFASVVYLWTIPSK